MKRYLMWFCLFFVIGILTICPVAEKPVVYISTSFCIGFLLVCLFKRRFIFAVLLLAAFVLGGYTMHADAEKDNTYSFYTDGKRIVCGKVVDSFYSGEYCVNVLETESVDYRSTQGRVKLYVKNGGLFNYGDRVYAAGQITVPQKPRKKDEVDYRAYNFSRGIYANCFAQSWSVRIIEEGGKGFSLEKLGMNSRRAIKNMINRMYPAQEAGVLTALMLGDKSGVSDEFKEIGSKVGIYHTMATSGLHVSILLTFFGLLTGRLGRRKIAALLNIILLVFIYVVIGYSPSISRAVIMAILVCISQLTDSQADSYTTLALSAAIILAFRPYALFDVGFLLSFASTLGILIIYKKVSVLIKNKLLSTLLVSIAALLGTGALTVLYFGRLTLLGTLSNVLIVPLAEIILPLGYISVIMSMIWFPLGDFLSFAVYPLIKLYILIAQLFAKLPFASAEVSKPPAYGAFIITIVIFAAFAVIPVKGDIYEGRTIKKRSAKQSAEEPVRLCGGRGISYPDLSAEVPQSSATGDEGI